MESAIAALVTGVLTLAGVIVSNSRSRAVTEVKIDNLTRQIEKHNCLIERTYALDRTSGGGDGDRQLEEGIAIDTFLTSNGTFWSEKKGFLELRRNPF